MKITIKEFKRLTELENELRELKKDYAEARREIKESKENSQILRESRDYWKERDSQLNKIE